MTLVRTSALVLALASLVLPEPEEESLRSVAALVAEIEELRERTPAETFDELGRHATKPALDAIQSLDRGLRDYASNYRLYRSLRFFAQDPALGPKAVEWLERRCKAAESDVHYAAAYALAEMGAVGSDAAERLCRRPPHDWIASIVLRCVLERIELDTERGDLELLLEHFEPGYSGDEAQLVTALLRFDGPPELRRMQGYLVDRSARPWVKLRVVSALERMGSARALKALHECVADAASGTASDAARAAIESLERLDYREHLKDLEKLADAGAPTVAAAALVARSYLEPRAERWVARIHELGASEEPRQRETAALALVGRVRRSAEAQPTAQETAALERLLADPDWRVREVLVEQLVELRSPACVPLLIARLETLEEEAEREELHLALELLTGADYGASGRRWRSWWEAEGHGQALPSREVAEERRKERHRRLNQQRRTTFYGMHVTQENVCFVLDASGSMEAKNEWDETRLDVVKQEVEGALTRMRDGTSFNVVFFGSSVRRWREELTPMDATTRQEAIEFVKAQEYLGGTAVYDALKAVFADPRVEHVYLLSDGEPAGGEIDDPDEIVEEVQRWNEERGLRIHCISAGYVNGMLVRLAEDSGGEFREAD